MMPIMLRAALPARPEARRILVGTLLSAISRGLTLPFLFVYLSSVRGLPAATVGLVVGWTGVLTLVLAPVGGALLDRLGPRRVVLPAFLIEACGVAGLALVHTTAQAAAVLTVCAVGASVVWAGQNTILATLTSEAERQRTFGLSFTLLNLGIGIGGLTSGMIVDVHRPVTFQTVYVIDALGYLIPAAILLSLRGVGRRPAAAETSPGQGTDGGYRTVLGDRPFRRLALLGLMLTICGYAQIEVGFTAFATDVARVAPRVIGWALAGNSLTIVAVQLFVLRWLEGRSRSYALAGVGAIFATSWAVLGLGARVPATVLAAAAVIGCAVIFSLGETLMSPVLPALTNALARPELRGRYNAVSSMIWGVSGVIGPVSAGPLIGDGHAGVWLGMVVIGGLVAAGLAVSLRRLLTPAQDGRAAAADEVTTTPAEAVPPAEPVAVGAAC